MLNKMAGFTEAVKQPLFQGWLQQLYNPWTSDCNYNKVGKCNSCTKCRCDKPPNSVVAANVHGFLTATTWQVQLHVYCNRHAITGPSVPLRPTYLLSRFL